ncbi:MAG: amino acid aminotransferase [Flaviaesturariibacter sp.]|nr:amino acid aminotransferase [Flaviaesturariibacter sp.]
MQSWINGRFMASSAATIPAADLALNRGYGVFDYIRVISGRPIFLEDHLRRLARSAATMRLALPVDMEELPGIIEALVRPDQRPLSGIRLTLTGGVAADGYSIGAPSLIITHQELPPLAADAFATGVRLLSVAHSRQLPAVKSIDYLFPIWMQPQMRGHGATDLLYHHNGIVSECPRSNLFVVTKEGIVATPKDGILAGITRAKVLECARGLYPVEERSVSLADVYAAAEVFITSTTKEILPVRAVDGREVGSGADTVSRALHGRLSDRITAYSAG